MTITITAFERSPDGGKGLTRDTRVRWALEEVGQPYQARLVSFRAMKEPALPAPVGASNTPGRKHTCELTGNGPIRIYRQGGAEVAHPRWLRRAATVSHWLSACP
jgi:hypothetical protein